MTFIVAREGEGMYVGVACSVELHAQNLALDLGIGILNIETDAQLLAHAQKWRDRNTSLQAVAL